MNLVQILFQILSFLFELKVISGDAVLKLFIGIFNLI